MFTTFKHNKYIIRNLTKIDQVQAFESRVIIFFQTKTFLLHLLLPLLLEIIKQN